MSKPEAWQVPSWTKPLKQAVRDALRNLEPPLTSYRIARHTQKPLGEVWALLDKMVREGKLVRTEEGYEKC